MNSERFEWHGWMLRRHAVKFASPDGDEWAGPTDLVVALDETGHEELRDVRDPYFGLGGCAVLGGQFLDLWGIWSRMKAQRFGGSATPLHAASLGRSATPEQKAAVGDFFRQNGFWRLAAMVTDKTTNQQQVPAYRVAAIGLIEHIRAIRSVVPFKRAVLIFESNERLHAETWRTFKELRPSGSLAPQLPGVEVEVVHGPKRLGVPAMEVADFVMNAAAGQVRAHLNGPQSAPRRDFHAVFHSVPALFSHFSLVDRVIVEPPSRDAAP